MREGLQASRSVEQCPRSVSFERSDEDVDRCITKKLERGAFLLPVQPAGEKYVDLRASNVASLAIGCRAGLLRPASPLRKRPALAPKR